MLPAAEHCQDKFVEIIPKPDDWDGRIQWFYHDNPSGVRALRVVDTSTGFVVAVAGRFRDEVLPIVLTNMEVELLRAIKGWRETFKQEGSG